MDYHKEATQIIAMLANSCSEAQLIGSMSTSIYDTAWVSMVSKPEDAEPRWLFPESFQVLLDSQSPKGGWDGLASETDTILNSLAALLALCRHHTAPKHTNGNNPPDLLSRISKAVVFLDRKLHQWDLSKADQVGFEIISPSIINSLRSFGICLYEPPVLMKLRAQKLRLFDVHLLYGSQQLAILHSLEAFDGVIDFDKLNHHMRNGSFLGSPSSTAAYLMNSSVWSNEGEQYLQTVFRKGTGQGSGKFPSAFPSANFELSWALSTFLDAGLTIDDLGKDQVSVIIDTLEQEFVKGDGCLGFASGFLPDADDTAKSILCLSHAKRHVSPEALIQTFDAGKCFKTYAMERNPSVSANCNVLNALLHLPQVENYSQQIANIILFTHRAWEDGSLRDKWNLSEEYSMMLLAQALSKFLSIRKEGRLQCLTESTAIRDVPLILMQILRRLLQRQSPDGSWGQGSSEITAYGVLGLGAICSTQEFNSLNPIVRDALQRAQHFLIGSGTKEWNAEPLWIEKICYTSKLLSNVYCISAVVFIETILNNLQSESTAKESMKLSKMAVFFSGLPLFANANSGDTLFSLVEAALYRPRLEKVRLSIFEQTNIGKDEYLNYIPFTWVGCNNISDHPQSTEIIWDMIYASMLIYQVDEYMETSVNRAFKVGVNEIRDCIRLICNTPHAPEGPDARIISSNIMDDVKNRLSHYASYFLLHPSVQRSPYRVQARLRSSMETFLQAHVTQILDNQAFARQESRDQFSTTKAYYDWVHTTSADHTSCSFSFLFFSCLVAEAGEELFQSVKAKYYSEAVIRHLATLCRQYNDYGSIQRDEAESNLNSINFPEFNTGILGYMSEPKGSKEGSKANLMELAEFEREGLNISLARLEDVIDVPTMEKVKLFVRVTDLYGQIYVARDITNRVK